VATKATNLLEYIHSVPLVVLFATVNFLTTAKTSISR